MTPSQPQTNSRWPHRWAVALVCATFPLIWVGGLVTTYDAGMAVPDWPDTYGYNLFLYPWQTWLLGPWDVLIEHGHRLLGALVGMLTIGFVVAAFHSDRRRWMRHLAVVALAAVCAQGLLGGMRVIFDEVQIARIHACAGPAFFALVVALAAFTSGWWRNDRRAIHGDSARRVQRLALLTTLLAYTQLVLGAQLRHPGPNTSPGDFRAALIFHLLVAAVLVVHVVLLAIQVWRFGSGGPALTRPTVALGALMLVQLALGGGTWVAKFGWPAWAGAHAWTAPYVVRSEGLAQSLVVTAHVAVGSLILATALLVALRALRLLRGAPRGWAPAPNLMEVAA